MNEALNFGVALFRVCQQDTKNFAAVARLFFSLYRRRRDAQLILSRYVKNRKAIVWGLAKIRVLLNREGWNGGKKLGTVCTGKKA
jgi:hypothetical protein